MGMFKGAGRRTRRLVAYLKRRAHAAPRRRPVLDCQSFPELFRKQAVVFTDTADFTVRTARDGILHCLMLFDRLVDAAEPVLRKEEGQIVKVDGDSLLLRFPDASAACRGVRELDRLLRRSNRGRPENEHFRFAYGIGFGDILDLEGDMFGLEVNLAAKLGVELARPGEALVSPAAAAAVDRSLLRHLVPYNIITLEDSSVPVQRLKLG